MSLTLQEAAERAGVHYMTVYRWVRTGRLPATKAEGTWAVRLEDLDALAAKPADAPQGRARRADHAGRLAKRLMAGDDAGALAVAEAALTGGMALDHLNVVTLPEAMTEVGRAWADGEIGVDVEHRATATTYRLLGRLAPRFARKGRRRGSIVLGAAPGEAHGLPVAMLADPLRRGHLDQHARCRRGSALRRRRAAERRRRDPDPRGRRRLRERRGGPGAGRRRLDPLRSRSPHPPHANGLTP